MLFLYNLFRVLLDFINPEVLQLSLIIDLCCILMVFTGACWSSISVNFVVNPLENPLENPPLGWFHGKHPPKSAHGLVCCTSEVTRAGSVPNNPPVDQLLGETMVSITCVINTLSGTWRSPGGAAMKGKHIILNIVA